MGALVCIIGAKETKRSVVNLCHWLYTQIIMDRLKSTGQAVFKDYRPNLTYQVTSSVSSLPILLALHHL
jgi:hypothetical protein